MAGAFQTNAFQNDAFQTDAGVQTLFPSLYTNVQTFYSALVTAQRTLAPELYVNSQIFYGPTVSQKQSLYPELFINTQTFFPSLVYLQYPDPADVRAGVRYGPGGIYVGTLTVGGGETIIRLRSFTERH